MPGLGGRPPIWDDPEAFAKKVDEYFDTEKQPTWSGLALYMGFESRKSLDDYHKKEGFSYPIKKALLKIEAIYESNLSKGNPAGSIFALKNFGWRDKQEVEQSGGITIKFENPTDYIYPSQDQSDSGIPESI
jgi:hypothetical protein